MPLVIRYGNRSGHFRSSCSPASTHRRDPPASATTGCAASGATSYALKLWLLGSQLTGPERGFFSEERFGEKRARADQAAMWAWGQR